MKQIAVMFGAGNIGRGFIGQLFSESGYEVIFVDVDEPLIESLNSHQSYPIRLVSNEKTEEITISPVRALHSRQTEEISEVLKEASIAATAVGARVLPMIAPLVAKGISSRAAANSSTPLNIIICENLKDAAASFRKMVGDHLTPEEQMYFQTHIGFVDTVIGRMVPPPTAEMRAEDPRLIAVEPFKELPVDRTGFAGQPPTISNMVVCDNFPAYTARKLYIHNCGHALLGYFGYLHGYEYGYQALEDTRIRTLFEQAMAESIQGIVAAYGVNAEWLQEHKNDLVARFANRSLGDTIFRIARDPLRKLAPRDRLIGAARLVEKTGNSPETLGFGIAAAYSFNHPEDPLAQEMQTMIAKEGIEKVMDKVSELKHGEALTDLVLTKYHHIQKERQQI